MWPEGFRCAVALTIDLDFETAWEFKDPDYESRPLGLSMARYGPNVGVPLLLSMLDDLGVQATFFVPGKSAETFPEAVRSVVDAGHEIAVHGYTHDPPNGFTREQEEEQLRRALKVLQGFGTEVIGYRAPFYEVSVHTIGLLQEHGLSYSSGSWTTGSSSSTGWMTGWSRMRPVPRSGNSGWMSSSASARTEASSS